MEARSGPQARKDMANATTSGPALNFKRNGSRVLRSDKWQACANMGKCRTSIARVEARVQGLGLGHEVVLGFRGFGDLRTGSMCFYQGGVTQVVDSRICNPATAPTVRAI